MQVKSTLFTDEAGPVMRRAVLDAISAIVKDRACHALFVYLAGHGVTHSAYGEKLLLSDVASDDAEAINLQDTRQRARSCGIPHVIIIYDACRSFATTDRLRAILGGPIFPAVPGTKIGGHVDVFYACAPDESSFEMPDTSGAHPSNYKAFFTEVLLDALRAPDTSLRDTQLGSRAIAVIPSSRLEDMLERQIPRRAAQSSPRSSSRPTSTCFRTCRANSSQSWRLAAERVPARREAWSPSTRSCAAAARLGKGEPAPGAARSRRRMPRRPTS